MPLRFSNPPGVHPPGSRYSHAAVVEGMSRLVVSGQIGLRPDGTVVEEPAAQVAQAVANLRAVLAAHALGPANLVRLGVFVTDRALVPVWREQREAWLAPHAPASTLLVVAGLADPRLVFEIEAEAAG